MAMDATTRFRVLLAEDDPVSLAFLVEAMRHCGAEVAACTDGLAALARARAETWNLLVLDHHLPGLAGDAILAALRADSITGARRIPAIATSAERDAVVAPLLAAGFAEVLPKPLSIAQLRAALRRHGCAATDPLDDDDALRACGSPAAVERLRHLFVEQELPSLERELEESSANPKRLRPTLHRLAASCGFCGAIALAGACAALEHALSTDAGSDRTEAALDTFRAAVSETRIALHDRLETDV